MRLINVGTLELSDFTLSKTPPYAILSHTWSAEELTFQEMTAGTGSKKKGYHKIRETCRLASEQGLGWAWVDTCCIDKASSAELTESINSMFKWYLDTAICFVWLEDLEPAADIGSSLSQCRWITRGWTLQELLAPEEIYFYDRSWTKRGSKSDLKALLSEVCKIDLGSLSNPRSLSQKSVAQRMSWAADRSTTREEDEAYCLLGIFDVNMPLIYGEGKKAFRRLQQEIVKQNNDLTIFAWVAEPTEYLEAISCFAHSPAAFKNSSTFTAMPREKAQFSITNRGIEFPGGPSSPSMGIVSFRSNGRRIITYALMLGQEVTNGVKARGGMALRKIGPSLYCRDSVHFLIGFGGIKFGKANSLHLWSGYCILDYATSGKLESGVLTDTWMAYRRRRLYIPPADDKNEIQAIAPMSLWDVTDRIFLAPYAFDRRGTPDPPVLAVRYEQAVKDDIVAFVLLATFIGDSPPQGRLIESSVPPTRGLHMLFHERNQDRHMLMSELVFESPEVQGATNSLTIRRHNISYRVNVTFQNQPSAGGAFDVWVPRFD